MELWRAVTITLWILGATASFFACQYVREIWLAIFQGLAM